MMSNEEKLQRLHRISMELLEKLDEVTKKENINYMLDAGTLLGAIRHKGFIPWDDDADVCMLREDYDRFLKIAKKHFSGDFEFILPGEDGDEAFYDFVPKIILKKAVVDKDSEDYRFYNGKYSYPALDIFVIDKMPDSNLGQALHTKHLILIYGMAMGHRRKIDYSRYGKIEAMVIWVLSKLGKHKRLSKIAKKYDRIARKYENKNTNYVMSTHSAMDHFGDCYKTEWYEKSARGEIDGKTFPIPHGYDGILQKHYGDYMSLPPKEKQNPKHLDFDKVEFLD